MRSVIETPLHDDFQCGCGCTWDTGGFDPCHEQEHLRGPDIGSGWDRTYICN
ncbi:MAG: hypothetical protein HOC20_13855, partial [Chloroflexi bacterium]|nr:hypothetical protein [Chloroflexota bacterium]